jgi:hypothetical protein
MTGVEISGKVVELAREKSKLMPVIIFCSQPHLYRQWIPEAEVFAGNEVGELISILKGLRLSSNAIVITTSVDSKGVDFLFKVPQAYSIHEVLPGSMV